MREETQKQKTMSSRKEVKGKQQQKAPQKTDWQEGMVYLFQFPRCTSVPNASPYCMKVETWLRMNNINYTVIEGYNTKKTKEGTYPSVELNGQEYPDSSKIIKDLSEIFQKQPLDAHLSNEQRGLSRAIVSMCDDSLTNYGGRKLNRAMAAIRYTDHINQLLSPNAWVKPPPTMMRVMLPILKSSIKKKVKTALFNHGIGKHSREDIIQIGIDDIRALSQILGHKHYMLGDKPNAVDCAVFATLAQVYYFPWDWKYRSMMQSIECENLRNYCHRMKERFWPDWEQICRKELATKTGGGASRKTK